MRNPFPPRKSKLTPLGKVLAATEVLDQVAKGALDEPQANAALREKVGLNWGLLTACQFLTGKEAIRSVAALPEDWASSTLTRAQILAALTAANYVCANAASGAASAGILVKQFKERPSDLGAI